MPRAAALALTLAACDLPEVPIPPDPVFVDEDGCPDGLEPNNTSALAVTQLSIAGGPVLLSHEAGTLRDGRAAACVSTNATAGAWRLLDGEAPVGLVALQVPGPGTWALPDPDVTLTLTLDASLASGRDGDDLVWTDWDQGSLTATTDGALAFDLTNARALTEGITAFLVADGTVGR